MRRPRRRAPLFHSRPAAPGERARRQPLPLFRMSDLDAVFRAVNASGTGAVTPAEVQAALALGGLTFSLQACAQLVRLHDGDRDGRVDRAEFGALHAFLDGLATAHAATASGGSVDRATVASLLTSAGLSVDAPPLDAAFAAFDADRDGRLDATEFVGLAAFLKAARAAFAAFGPQGGGGGGGGSGGVVTLTLDQCASLWWGRGGQEGGGGDASTPIPMSQSFTRRRRAGSAARVGAHGAHPRPPTRASPSSPLHARVSAFAPAAAAPSPARWAARQRGAPRARRRPPCRRRPAPLWPLLRRQLCARCAVCVCRS